MSAPLWSAAVCGSVIRTQRPGVFHDPEDWAKGAEYRDGQAGIQPWDPGNRAPAQTGTTRGVLETDRIRFCPFLFGMHGEICAAQDVSVG
jgi:hypothetical protein